MKWISKGKIFALLTLLCLLISTSEAWARGASARVQYVRASSSSSQIVVKSKVNLYNFTTRYSSSARAKFYAEIYKGGRKVASKGMTKVVRRPNMVWTIRFVIGVRRNYNLRKLSRGTRLTAKVKVYKVGLLTHSSASFIFGGGNSTTSTRRRTSTPRRTYRRQNTRRRTTRRSSYRRQNTRRSSYRRRTTRRRTSSGGSGSVREFKILHVRPGKFIRGKVRRGRGTRVSCRVKVASMRGTKLLLVARIHTSRDTVARGAIYFTPTYNVTLYSKLNLYIPRSKIQRRARKYSRYYCTVQLKTYSGRRTLSTKRTTFKWVNNLKEKNWQAPILPGVISGEKVASHSQSQTEQCLWRRMVAVTPKEA